MMGTVWKHEALREATQGDLKTNNYTERNIL